MVDPTTACRHGYTLGYCEWCRQAALVEQASEEKGASDFDAEWCEALTAAYRAQWALDAAKERHRIADAKVQVLTDRWAAREREAGRYDAGGDHVG